jgi:hypothetical protein
MRLLWFLTLLAAAPSAHAWSDDDVEVEMVGGIPTHVGRSNRDFGFTIAAGIPHPFTIELEKVFSPGFSGGISLGGLGLPIRTDSGFEGRYGISTLNLHGRWHPWRGTFFLGGVLGAQAFYAFVSKDYTVPSYGTLPAKVEAQISGMIFSPHFGWFWVTRSGFTLGFEFGWQFPLGSRTRLFITSDDERINDAIEEIQATAEYQRVQAELDRVGDRLGKAPLPYVTALRIGWMF